MTNFAAARENMVESQVRPNGITDRRILAAMAGIAREAFVPDALRAVAYADEDLPVAPGRSLVEAMAFARLAQLAEVKPDDRVLVVGAGVGYGAAVLAQLAAQVVALEQDQQLLSVAKAQLGGLANVKVVEGALADGCRSQGPYDVVLFEGRVGEVPEAIFAQVAEGGRVVAAVGEGPVAKAHVWNCAGHPPALRLAFDVAVAPLPGLARKRPAFVF
jgi:protein-L-isoaspartate(D-aspartate) O-methyltransferase